MTAPHLDPLLLDPTRLSIVALLAGAEWAEFGAVRDSAQVSDSTLSKRVTQLGDAGYVEVRKGYVGKRPRTWLNLSPAGRSALSAHIAMLQQIATQADRAPVAHSEPAADRKPAAGLTTAGEVSPA